MTIIGIIWSMQSSGAGEEKGLGQRLQQCRQKAGMTQQALCQKAGLSYSTLAKIERGAIKTPSIFTISRVAQAIGVSLDEIMGLETPNGASQQKKRTKSGITFIYFDINGCLVRFFHRAFTRIAEDTGIASDIVETAFWHFNDEVCKGVMSTKEFNRAFAKRLGIPSIDWQQYYLRAVDPIKEMHELVEWVARNYRLGLLSNIGSGFVEDMRQHNLIPKVHFDAVIDSSKVGVIKPDPKIYEIAETAAGVKPAEILFVDDSRANLIPAQKRGWHVMWFNDYDSVESTERVRAALEPADV